MVAEAIVQERTPLWCNCRRVMRRGDQVLTVKARLWDCPSCGYDKRRTLRDMVAAEGSRWLLTLTYTQPPAYDAQGRPLTPPEHAQCDRSQHVYEYTSPRGHTSWRWRVLPSCSHCCRRRSSMMKKLVKRLRRLWGAQVGYLHVIEPQKNGALHLHLAMSGIPVVLARQDRVRVAKAWQELGGGFSDFRPPPPGGSAGGMGWYLGKYLAKRQDHRMAAGFRRWSRSGRFAAALRMRWIDPNVPPAVAPRQGEEIKAVGWRHPFTSLTSLTRVWVGT